MASSRRQTKRKIKIQPKMAKSSTKKKISTEVGLLGQALRSLGGLGGGMVGGLIGQPAAGSAAGSSLMGAVSKWLGAGDYEVSRNTIVTRAAAGIPAMHNTGQSVIVRHKEFVTSIRGSSAFTVQNTFNLNPGLASTFPWLANIASRFQEYEFKGLVWHYVPTSGTFNGTSAALGSVMLQTTYRSTDTAPASKTEMMNEYCANETVPFDSMAHPVECDPKENPFSIHYVRNVGITSGEPLMYDLGTTFVATIGQSNSNDFVGDLWVTYEVELKKPLITSPVVQNVQYFSTTFAGGTSSNLFSGTQGPSQGSMPISFSTSTINMPDSIAGIFYIKVQVNSTGGLTAAATVSMAVPTTTNLSAFAFDGTHNTTNTTVTGTNPSTNILAAEGGYFYSDAYTAASLTYPTLTVTSGSITNVEVLIVKIA